MNSLTGIWTRYERTMRKYIEIGIIKQDAILL